MEKTIFILTLLVCCVVLAVSSFAQVSRDRVEQTIRLGIAREDGAPGMGVTSSQNEEKAVPYKSLSQATYPEYPIRPHTVLHITLKGDEKHLEDPGKTLKVSSKGTIAYPYIGEIEVVNMTEMDVEKKIEELLKKDYVRSPEVSVTVVASPGYWILGDVTTPGRYDMPMDRELNLTEALALAGDFAAFRGGSAWGDTGGVSLFRNDWTRVRVVRTEFGERREYLFKYLDIPQDFTVKPDDIVLCRYGKIAELGSYYIFGEVQNPGKYPIVSDDFSGKKLFSFSTLLDKYITILGSSNVVDAVLGAEGLTDNAARNWAYLVREEDGKIKRWRIPLGHIFYKGNMKTNMKLKDGDVITVSESWF